MTQDVWRLMFNYSVLVIIFIFFSSSEEAKAEGVKHSTSSYINGQSKLPPKYDDWCRKYCSSHYECYNKFQHDYVDLQAKIQISSMGTPGVHLFQGQAFEKSITRQTFETQFIFDISHAVNITPCKVYITDVFPDDGTHSSGYASSPWNVDNVVVSFQLFNTSTYSIKELTKQAQDPMSLLYRGQITKYTLMMYGIKVPSWDVSLKLMLHINIIDINHIRNIDGEKVYNQGGARYCEYEGRSNSSDYCNFEMHFRSDIASSLAIDLDNVEILFVRQLNSDGVVINFRFIPSLPFLAQGTEWVQNVTVVLSELVQKFDSTLYDGNVLYRLDPAWGINGSSRIQRVNSKRLNRSTQPNPLQLYERCKLNQRCNRALVHYNDSEASSVFTMQRFPGGKHEVIPLFSDFENWREGTANWARKVYCNSESCRLHRREEKPRGAHWSPFDFSSVGPSIVSFGSRQNNGLVLNLQRKYVEEDMQKKLINETKDKLKWIRDESRFSAINATTYYRIDIMKAFNKMYQETEHLLERETEKLRILSNSQCIIISQCKLLFNTSSLMMTGIINASGTVGYSPDGTEVAVWTFDSIDLGAEVEVEVDGQRAFALLSKSSVHINTTIVVEPGTLGGFPGGLSTYRRKEDRLSRVCSNNVDFLESWTCQGDHPVSREIYNKRSNNVNGPGSPSFRVYFFQIRIHAANANHEIHTITTYADPGQTIGGGFHIHYNEYSTPFIRHDITALELKYILEFNLNPAHSNSHVIVEEETVELGIGSIAVSRFKMSSNCCSYEWKITFLSSKKRFQQLSSTNLLTGEGARLQIQKLVNMADIAGSSFTLEFMGSRTREISYSASNEEMKYILEHDIPTIVHATVSHNTSNKNCYADTTSMDDCDQEIVYASWDLSLATKVGNISPSSPTSPEFDSVGEISELIARNNKTDCANSVCPNITVVPLSFSPFSLSYGGGGASYGGKGGLGFGKLPQMDTYGEKYINNLHGGSGGSLGFTEPFDTAMLGIPEKARGGSGGGAIEIVAQNDIVFGVNAFISCNGENGWGGFMTAGGGGSGGSIVLAAGGVVDIKGKLEVNGGDGGIPSQHQSIFVGGGGSGGRIAVYGESITIRDSSNNIQVSGGKCSPITMNDDQICMGSDGTIYKEMRQNIHYSFDDTVGAMNTTGSLHFYPTEKIKNSNNYIWLDGGPSYTFPHPIKPDRFSFFVKAANVSQTISRDWGLSFILSCCRESKNETLLGFSFGPDMKHGQMRKGGLLQLDYKQQMSAFFSQMNFNKWYKVDVLFNWKNMIYDINVDDYVVVEGAQLNLPSVLSLSISALPSNVEFWLDELFVGNDATLGFKCPSDHSKIVPTDFFVGDGRDWKLSDLGDKTSFFPMTHHESHLSQRVIYTHRTDAGSNSFDGKKHYKFRSDVKSIPNGIMYKDSDNAIKSGNTILVKNGDDFVHVWYGEYHVLQKDELSLRGGVGACSTIDMKTWKNEGILIHDINVTDMVTGSEGPFHIERPRVIYNERTQKYVMWMIIDNDDRSLGMAGVAISDHFNGPFDFVRSFYPDGNKTRDQILFKDKRGDAFLIRTYYETIEYILPSPIMQPIWESVKNSDGTINFPLTYHRAHYEPGYDDFHDIYRQRWSKEDKPWKVLCVDTNTKVEKDILYGSKGKEHCSGPSEYMVIKGQGDPMYESTNDGIKSRFLDPNDPFNNVWKPSSVPLVNAKSWKENYEAGTCGIRSVNDDMESFDLDLESHKPNNRSRCSKIADNPIHPTLPDQLAGKPQVVERRRAKFIAVSKLTDDFLDTTGLVSRFEGELEDGSDLSNIVNQAKDSFPFGWELDEEVDILNELQIYNTNFKTLSNHEETRLQQTSNT